jgi:hypothetical protein
MGETSIRLKCVHSFSRLLLHRSIVDNGEVVAVDPFRIGVAYRFFRDQQWDTRETER